MVVVVNVDDAFSVFTPSFKYARWAIKHYCPLVLPAMVWLVHIIIISARNVVVKKKDNFFKSLHRFESYASGVFSFKYVKCIWMLKL